ncbi:uncharacterized protein si:cabz01007807.1 isoform X3 [Hypomesus transpacificus]|uniref:uncharacterized protein si:cabz01007807.1 isoform X3 n=1 Tax=Hypomesus transpacificus TaxID=137520 RepID=UPI001F087133|nr:uncharacterized protein si:cabz01007807.1 isoform X3 [Hypomesus transpacificus]
MQEEVERDESQTEPSEESGFTGERRPSLIKLRGMLRRVSQSPFQKQYKNIIQSTSSESSVNDSQSEEMDRTPWNPFHSGSENGVNGKFSRDNPFYTHYKESLDGRVDGKEDRRGSSDHSVALGEAGLSTIFAPPPEFDGVSPDVRLADGPTEAGVPIERHPETIGPLEATPSQLDFLKNPPPKRVDLFQAPSTNEEDPFRAPSWIEEDLFQTLPTKKEDPFQSLASKGESSFQAPATNGDDLFQPMASKVEDLFHVFPTKLEDPFQSVITTRDDLFGTPAFSTKDPFQSSLVEENDLFRATPITPRDVFHTPSDKAEDFFYDFPSKMEDPFQSTFTKGEDLFQSPAHFTEDPFQKRSTNVPDPFPASPLESSDPFSTPSNQTPDIFHTAPPKTQGFFHVTPNAKARQNTPSFPPPSEKNSDVHSSSEMTHHLFKLSASDPQPSIHPAPSDKLYDITLTTPDGTKHDIAQPTPTSLKHGTLQARSLSPTPNGTIQVSSVTGRPKPAPRTKVHKQSNHEPDHAAPRPAPRVSHTAKNSTPEGEEDQNVFTDILLIGQEKCVEDWPEDSPELCSDWKPSGKFRLRRESMKLEVDSDRASGEEENGSGKQSKHRKGKKFIFSKISRRGSKDKFTDDANGRDGSSLRRGSKEGYLDAETPKRDVDLEEEEPNREMDDRKPRKHLKHRVSQLLRRGSKEHKREDVSGSTSSRRCSEDTGLHEDEEGEDENSGSTDHALKAINKVKVKFVPRRGFSISREKENPQDDPKFTPRRGSKEKPEEELSGACGYTPQNQSQNGFPDDGSARKGADLFCARAMDDENLDGPMEDKPTKSNKLELRRPSRKGSKSPDEWAPESPQDFSRRRHSMEGYLDEDHLQKGGKRFAAEQWNYDEQNGMEDCKPKTPSKFKFPTQRKSKVVQETFRQEDMAVVPGALTPRRSSTEGFLDEGTPQKGAHLFYAGQNVEDEEEEYKPKKRTKFKGALKKSKGEKSPSRGVTGPPGATSSDYYHSEAAEAEWCSAQMDGRLAGGLEGGGEEEEEEEEEEGDTDSLMEWWNTVEQWDELPSDDEDKNLEVDETKSFTSLAEKVHRALCVFNKLYTERAEILWQHVMTLGAIADDISSFHRKAKIGNITGGTTAAVGGMAAIAGIALAPLTFGASLIVTAVGVGVAAAGGITTATATISDNVNNMQDRKKVEVVLENFEARLEDLARVLRYIVQGLFKLRVHPLLRAGTQHYSGDWEVRRAVQMVSLVDRPALRAGEVTESLLTAVRSLFQGMDKYFTKDSRELKKGCKKEVVSLIKSLAHQLHRGLVELNAIREELQDARGGP